MTLSVEVQRRVRKWAPPRADIATWPVSRWAEGSRRELGVRSSDPQRAAVSTPITAQG